MQVTCPFCLKVIETGQAMAGQVLLCPFCQGRITAPGAEAISQPTETEVSKPAEPEEPRPSTHSSRRAEHLEQLSSFHNASLWAGVLAAIVFGLFVVVVLNISQSRPGGGSLSRTPGTVYQAGELASMYLANRAVADRDCLNETIGVRGVVRFRGRDANNVLYMTLETGNSLCRVHCIFSDRHTKTVERIERGDTVGVRGLCQGLSLGNVVLNKCSLYEK